MTHKNSNNRPTYYITTAIPYVNAKPHLGFALEIVLTDALADPLTGPSNGLLNKLAVSSISD